MYFMNKYIAILFTECRYINTLLNYINDCFKFFPYL